MPNCFNALLLKASMSNIEALLQPHSIEAACIANRANGKSFILIDVGRDSRGHSVLSLERLKRKVEKCLVTDKKQVFLTTKLYIVGEWNAADLGGGQTDVCFHIKILEVLVRPVLTDTVETEDACLCARVAGWCRDDLQTDRRDG